MVWLHFKKFSKKSSSQVSAFISKKPFLSLQRVVKKFSLQPNDDPMGVICMEKFLPEVKEAK